MLAVNFVFEDLLIESIEAAFKEAVNDPELELVEIGGTKGEEDHHLSIYTDSNKKLVELARSSRDGAAIAFNFRHAQGSESYSIIFRRQNNQWIITR